MKNFSIVIVNYNSTDYLLVCLDSVYRALHIINDDAEVFVVDNNSSQNPQEIIKRHFPQIIYIQNSDNKGFAEANNRAISMATGKYLLLLNPDTVLPEDCFSRIYDFAERHSDFGAIGIRGISSNGTIMPEHRRNIPTIWNQFCKVSYLDRIKSLCPKNKTFFDRSFPDTSEGEINVTSGSFLLLNRNKLKDNAFMDDEYFMYFEDTDLCMRIIKSGLKIYYLPISFLHFKSTSSNRCSRGFVDNYFNAMRTFFRKHSESRSGYYMALCMIGIAKSGVLLTRKLHLADIKHDERQINIFSTDRYTYKEIISCMEKDKGQHCNCINNPKFDVTVSAKYRF